MPLRRKKRHILALLVLANYLLALTAGSSFHDHHGRHCDELSPDCVSSARAHLHACGHTNTCSRASSCDADAALPQYGSRSTNSLDSHHVKCPVCEFLAQKPIPSVEVTESCVAPLCEALAPSTPSRCSGDVPSSYRVRAPPAVA